MTMTFMIIFAMVCVGTSSPADPPLVTIDRDNVEIAQSCRVKVAASPIVDADGNGVIHITASDITVEFDRDSPALHGATSDQTPDTFAGKGIVITGRNVTLSGAKVSGYKVGVHAIKADGLTVHDMDVSNSFHQRLKSTPQAEDAADWLWPHANDNNEWITNYGAGVCVEDSKNVTLHDIRARKTQNGIILDAVNDSKVYDCDCSFLSGWGLAMWRSNRNVISRNAFDFCVRGYSHGVYNRGQDSAGILMFEQCCENVIAENSATHCGDGFFGFAGKEALGEVNPREDRRWYARRGNNENLFVGNDFSFAAAHGLELTFSFDNKVQGNTFVGNAICGIWGGYSQSTLIRHNTYAMNGDAAYGLERGGINIEHGSENLIVANEFSHNACAIYLWSDDDQHLSKLPWAVANTTQSRSNAIIANAFAQNILALHLRETTDTVLNANRGAFERGFAASDVDLDDHSRSSIAFDATAADPGGFPVQPLHGERNPIGNRGALAGREHIIMTEWGPWDHASPLLQFMEHFDTADVYRLRGATVMPTAGQIRVEGNANVRVERDMIAILPRQKDTVTPYHMEVEVAGHALRASGVLTGSQWRVMTFPSAVDPRENAEQWREKGIANARRPPVDKLDLRFGSGGMAEALGLAPMELPRDHFGVIATNTLTFPPGQWRITTTSDDGIRVWMDEKLIIDDWTHHAPKKHTHDFEVTEPREVKFRVEYFELDGHALLSLDITREP
jgi:parallel beta-helix repeat protein